MWKLKIKQGYRYIKMMDVYLISKQIENGPSN